MNVETTTNPHQQVFTKVSDVVDGLEHDCYSYGDLEACCSTINIEGKMGFFDTNKCTYHQYDADN